MRWAAALLILGGGLFTIALAQISGGSFSGVPILTPVALASLPTCAAGTKGMLRAISDGAATPIYEATATNGGTVIIPVYCDGTNWTNH